MKVKFLIYASVSLTILSCSNSTSEDIVNEDPIITQYEWVVPLSDIVGSFNPFPFAENPTLSTIENVGGLNDNSTVAIISFNEEINIYPLTYIHPFETVNDTLTNNSFTISYCPITQSTITINRVHRNEKLTFRASGILYKENLVMHDNLSDSFWSQMLLKNIKGPFENETIQIFSMIETTWKTAKTYFPSAHVFTSNSIVSSKSNNSLGEIDNDEKVFGLIDNINNKNSEVFIYQYSHFNTGIQLYKSGFASKKIVIGSQDLQFITAFLNEENTNFEPVQNEFPIIMIDEFGNKWNVFGYSVSGPNMGEKLEPATAFVASWWAWEDFYNSFSFLE